MTKYENDSQLLFVTSEANFSNNGIGNQNHFKVNLADSPLKNNDSSLIKLSVKELKLRKSWYNINETNNRVRMSLQGYNTGTSSALVIPDIDVMLEIPVGDYLTHESLVTAFSSLVVQTLVTATSALTPKIITTDITVTINTAVYESSINPTASTYSGKLNPSASASRNDYRLAFELACGITDFRWTNPPIFQFLNIPIAKTCTLNVTGGTNLEENDRFNDSYLLLGGPRVESFQGTIAAPIWSLSSYDESLSVKVKTGAQRTLVIASWFPMSESLHTLDDVYVLSRQSRSQASSSLQSTTNEHAHNFIASNLIAKASRDVTNDIGVYFRITQPSYFFSVLTQPFINEVEFELKDHRGRDLPYNKTTTPPVGYLATNINEYTGPPQIESGNSVVSLVVLAEKYIGDSPSSLQGFPDPVGIYNPKFKSNITMPNRFC